MQRPPPHNRRPIHNDGFPNPALPRLVHLKHPPLIRTPRSVIAHELLEQMILHAGVVHVLVPHGSTVRRYMDFSGVRVSKGTWPRRKQGEDMRDVVGYRC